MKNLTREQQVALQAIYDGHNVFLTGKAGTGKSTIIDIFKQQAKGNIVYLAPTGRAATAIGGVTIHSFFKMPIGVVTNQTLKPLSDEDKMVLENVTTIVIDEISMVRSDLFWAIFSRLNSIARPERAHLPLGGVQLIVVGDFHQLPPVVSTKEELSYLNNEHSGIYAFDTLAWQQLNFKNIDLQVVHRQKDDLVFTNILNNIRVGDTRQNIKIDVQLPLTDALTAVNHLTSKPILSPPMTTSICTTKNQVDEINYRMHSCIQGQSHYFNAEVFGYFNEKDYPTEEHLDLKVGAEVILLNNGPGYTNGTQARIIGFDPQGKHIVVQLLSGQEIAIVKHDWEQLSCKRQVRSYLF